MLKWNHSASKRSVLISKLSVKTFLRPETCLHSNVSQIMSRSPLIICIFWSVWKRPRSHERACIWANCSIYVCPPANIYAALYTNFVDRISCNKFFNVQEISVLLGHLKQAYVLRTHYNNINISYLIYNSPSVKRPEREANHSLHLVQMLRTCGAVPPFPHTTLPFTLIYGGENCISRSSCTRKFIASDWQ
jgi:hypothetical protein